MRTWGQRRAKQATGFSLVELMIVVAVLGIIAAMYLPRFAGVEGKGKDNIARTEVEAIIKQADFYRDQRGGESFIEADFDTNPGGEVEYPPGMSYNTSDQNWTYDNGVGRALFIDENGSITVDEGDEYGVAG